MKFLKSAAALAVLAAVCAAPAQAAVNSSATGSFSYVLFDLDATDAITPSISFGTGSLSAGSTVWSNEQYAYDSKNYDATIKSVVASMGYSTGTASATGTTLTAGGNALGTTVFGPGSLFSSYANSIQYFNLTANTVVVFQMNYQLTANATASDEEYENVTSRVGMELKIDNSFEDGYNGGEGSKQNQYTSASFDTYLTESLSKTSKLFITYVSDRATSGTLNLNANAYGYTSVSGVPEPETYAMLLAGLGLIGTVARRRNTKQA